MEKINNFYDLDAWVVARDITKDVYRLTDKFPKQELFGVTSQLRRATTSIMANLAEGFARFHYKDKVKFYYNARASAAEVLNFYFIAIDLDYIEQDDFEKINIKIERVSKLINGLIRALKETSNTNS